MAESVVALITDNIVNTFNNHEIVYNDETHLITCEEQRTVTLIDNRYPFLELFGPIAEIVGRARGVMTVDLNYVATMHINVNDQESLDLPPITRITRNVHADLIKIITADITRGGNALHTQVSGGFGGYFEGDDYIVYVEFIVKTHIRDDDPYFIGGM